MIVQFIETGKFEPFEYELDLDEEFGDGDDETDEEPTEQETDKEDDSEGEVEPDEEKKLRKTEL